MQHSQSKLQEISQAEIDVRRVQNKEKIACRISVFVHSKTMAELCIRLQWFLHDLVLFTTDHGKVNRLMRWKEVKLEQTANTLRTRL